MMKKKDSKKKKKPSKKKQKPTPGTDLKALKSTVKKLEKSVSQLEKAFSSLQTDLKKLKKAGKKASKVVPDVVKPVPPKAKTGLTKPPARKTATRASAARKSKPGPKPRSTTKASKPAAPKRPSGPTDLRFIQGLGAKIESLMTETGIKSFSDLAKASQTKVKSVLLQAGPRFKNQDPKSLIDQAKLVHTEKWTELDALQKKLMEGKSKPGPKVGSIQK